MNPDTEQLTNLFNEITTWTVLQIAVIVVAVYASLVVAGLAAPRVAPHMPGRLRLLVLNAVPVLRLVLFTLAAVWIIPLLFNVTLRNFVLVLGTIGVALGCAVKDWATSAAAGIVAVFERPYRPGDWVRSGKHYGEGVEVGTRSLRLRTPEDDTVTIPHSTIWSEPVANANDSAETLMCTAVFRVAPGPPAEGVRQLLQDVALTSLYAHYDNPVIVVCRNTALATTFTLKAYPFDMRDQFTFVTDLTLRGGRALREAGIAQISLPLGDDGGFGAGQSSEGTG